MSPDDEVCLCFHVPLRKIAAFLERDDPPVASMISDCLGAGTGCRWCVPFLQKLHEQHRAGRPIELRVAPERYSDARSQYKTSGDRPAVE